MKNYLTFSLMAVYAVATEYCEWSQYEEEPESVGYYCIGCGSTQPDDGYCDMCGGYSLSPI